MTVAAPRWRLVLGDDHHLMVEALRSALSRKHQVVAVAYDAEAIVAAVQKHLPDLLLLDLSLPERNGLEVIPDVLAASPATRIIVVSMHLDRTLTDPCLKAGASGFVPKDAGLAQLNRAIETVMSGERIVPTRVPKSSNRVSLKASHAALAQLTPRQHEILRLIADGRTSAEIAQELGLGEGTIAFHRTNIRAKLGVDSERGLLRYALLLQLEESDERLGLRAPRRTRGG